MGTLFWKPVVQASFDAFSDYEARGRRFKQLVQSLPEKEIKE